MKSFFSVLFVLFSIPAIPIAPILFGNELPKEEIDYIADRLDLNRHTIEDFVGEKLQTEVSIAIGFSGGGLRAAIFSLAMLRGLQEIGLYNGLRYMQGVSGSAWMILDLLARKTSLDEFDAKFQKQVAIDHDKFSSIDWISVFQAMQQKRLLGEDVSLVDFFGCTVADALLPDLAGKGQEISIQSFRDGLSGGRVPFPIVSVSLTDDGVTRRMPWAEITPYYFGSLFQSAYVDTLLVGNQFKACEKANDYPPQKLSYFFGLVGSFYAIDPNELARFSPVVREILKYDPAFGYRHLAPSMVPNFLYQCPGQQMNEYKNLRVIDAGHEANLGIISLLREGRLPDIILIGAAAYNAQANTYPELRRASIYARNNGLPFPDIQKPSKKIGQYIDVFEGEEGEPTIVYYANPVYFSTLKLWYTKKEYLKVSDAIRDLVRRSKPELVRLIKSVGAHQP